jgi:hypothetical protein
MSAPQQPGERLAVRAAAQPSTDVGDRGPRFMTWFVRIAGLYNASAVVVLLTPGASNSSAYPSHTRRLGCGCPP